MRLRLDSMTRPRLTGALALALLAAAPAARAQGSRFDASLQLSITRHGTFDETDAGAGARLSYRLTGWLGIDAHLNWFPKDLGDPAFSSSRTQGLVGLKAGRDLTRSGVYGAVRPGFLRFGEAPQAFACILIFPPPLACSLAAGETAFTLDLAAGYQLLAGDDVVVRFELGDGMVRYPGPAIDGDGEAHQDAFWKHGLRATVSVGWRF
jgi:hypothetical protein